MPQIRCLSVIAITVVSLLAGIVEGEADSLTPSHFVPFSPEKCENPPYRTRIISKNPLVIYIANFLTDKEMKHVLEVAKNDFSRSEVAEDDGTSSLANSRTSQSAVLTRDDTVRCIEERALNFQGFDTGRAHLESIQLVKYGTGEKYNAHTDWFDAELQRTAGMGGNRESSFFAYVEASNITGGGTNFPLIEVPRDEKWCDYIDCDEPWENGVTFRPIPGSAVFWQNMLEDGSGDPNTLHAGLPVTSGLKIGMNIWTRQWPMNPIHNADSDDEGYF
ncbi:hypothetical protein HYFRA_00009613 [Hymenoscyphus fraxineus]|uniref:Fe2OG dioxygenase domain-containing protein n=1 Tax=Hymenoscyphus fraxineus TaxID=746836 RepID=A0A9N9KQZ9_9HELO|nr:hypothetical protein HYFRA_00009613 [Hymenoscyphus fraxineus]